ncbi:peroxiredoxin [Sandaracinobacteroides hominis]|uniref:peroxiredoxin n=1 Tax=Sandaracinobacteroides hominis TaxID=2780086 RepID=UPI0018F387D1|nr:peroxiredoxin [Sandaracinobacteroides hominis]
MTIEAGSKAPDFTLESTSGSVSLADFVGRKLVLFFYPKDDTTGCTAEALQFTALAAEFAASGTSVIGVSKDTVAKHRKFIAKHQLGVELASDPEGETIAAYGSWVEKSLYGRKYMGIDRSTFLIGPDGMIAACWRKVKVAGHAEAVLKATREL